MRSLAACSVRIRGSTDWRGRSSTTAWTLAAGSARRPRCPCETANSECRRRRSGGYQPDGLLAHGPARGAHRGPWPDVAMATSAAPAHPATDSPSVPARPSGTAAVTIAAVGDTMLGTPDLPPDPATYLDPVKRSSAPARISCVREPRRHADHRHGQQMRPERRRGQLLHVPRSARLRALPQGRRIHDPEQRQQPLHGLRCRRPGPDGPDDPRRRPGPDRPTRRDHAGEVERDPGGVPGLRPLPLHRQPPRPARGPRPHPAGRQGSLGGGRLHARRRRRLAATMSPGTRSITSGRTGATRRRSPTWPSTPAPAS